MDTKDAYEYFKTRLDGDYAVFEKKLLSCIDKYGDDYDRFIKLLETNIEKVHLCCRKWRNQGYFLNNTYVDTLCQYMFTRDMLDRTEGPVSMFEFSPFRGWSTFVQLRAIYDSGRKDVEMTSCDIKSSCIEKTSKFLKSFKDHIAYDCITLKKSDVMKLLKKMDSDSIDHMFIDSDHGRKFTKDYIEAGAFRVCKKDAYIHIHDFVFWTKLDPEKYAEPTVVADYVKNNEDKFKNYTMGQLFNLVGGENKHESLVEARSENENSKYFTDVNVFVREGMSKKYWLGGTIMDINKKGIHKNKTWLSGLAGWMIPNDR